MSSAQCLSPGGSSTVHAQLWVSGGNPGFSLVQHPLSMGHLGLYSSALILFLTVLLAGQTSVFLFECKLFHQSFKHK